MDARIALVRARRVGSILVVDVGWRGGRLVGWLSPWDRWVSLPGGGQSENLGWSRVMSWEEIGKSVINLGLMLMCVCVVLTH